MADEKIGGVMDIETLIKKRKKLGISRKKIVVLMKGRYSVSWIEKIESRGERRFSPDFYKAYKEAIEKCENFFKD